MKKPLNLLLVILVVSTLIGTALASGTFRGANGKLQVLMQDVGPFYNVQLMAAVPDATHYVFEFFSKGGGVTRKVASEIDAVAGIQVARESCHEFGVYARQKKGNSDNIIDYISRTRCK